MAVVEVSHLKKVYPAVGKAKTPFVAVKDLSFSIEEGEIVGLLGPNGAGKSTTISMLLGVLLPTSGSIRYFGKDFSSHRSHILSQVTFASTYIRMPWRLSVFENLMVYAQMYGLSSSKSRKRIAHFLEAFGVVDQMHKTMNNLSAGQVTRVMLAKAFIPHPKVVLLDEPTASLDPDISMQVRAFVLEQQRQFRTTILYTSHNMAEVSDVCDKVMVLKKGQVIATDTPDNLARSVSTSHMRLLITDGLKRAITFAKGRSLETEVDGRELVVTLNEQDIADFLSQLAKHGISYSQISIRQPSLEDYFLKVSAS